MANQQKQKSGALNLLQVFAEWLKGESVPPGLINEMRRMQRRTARLTRYRDRNASYPYASERQNTREKRKRKRIRLEVQVAA